MKKNNRPDGRLERKDVRESNGGSTISANSLGSSQRDPCKALTLYQNNNNADLSKSKLNFGTKLRRTMLSQTAVYLQKGHLGCARSSSSSSRLHRTRSDGCIARNRSEMDGSDKVSNNYKKKILIKTYSTSSSSPKRITSISKEFEKSNRFDLDLYLHELACPVERRKRLTSVASSCMMSPNSCPETNDKPIQPERKFVPQRMRSEIPSPSAPILYIRGTTVSMEAYRNQVGGHSQFMKVRGTSKLYKPLGESEYKFYERLNDFPSKRRVSSSQEIDSERIPCRIQPRSINDENKITDNGSRADGCSNRLGSSEDNQKLEKSLTTLQQFVPKYFGSLSVSRQSNGRPNEILCANMSDQLSSSVETAHSENTKIENVIPIRSVCSSEFEIDENKRIPSAVPNPADIKVRQSSQAQLEFLILEDLVYSYRKPCVLDMKMGRIQRSKTPVSAEKRKRQIKKAIETTSHELAFRFCGCQYYDIVSDTMCYKDKYWGRTLTKFDVRDAIRLWFWNGVTFHGDLVFHLLSKLRALRKCINELNNFRFWSCSLLWIYDGGLMNAISRRASADIKLIDFANSSYLPDDHTPDHELLLGLDNLSSFLLRVLPTVTFERPILLSSQTNAERQLSTTSCWQKNGAQTNQKSDRTSEDGTEEDEITLPFGPSGPPSRWMSTVYPRHPSIHSQESVEIEDGSPSTLSSEFSLFDELLEGELNSIHQTFD